MIAKIPSALAVLVVTGSAWELVHPPVPFLVWNTTHSAPVGLYRRSESAIAKGSWVLVRPPDNAAALAATRGYLPANIPMVKRIAAMTGDHVCRNGAKITINEKPVALALKADSQGRPLPDWQGCKRLADGELFLLTAPLSSFDGRYFGVVSAAHLIEKVEPLWTF